MNNLPSKIATSINSAYTTPKHILFLEKTAIECIFGKRKRVIVTMPPRHGKSEYISKYFPAWLMLNFKNLKVLLASYEANFAAKWSREARDIYLRYYTDLKIARNNYWETSDNSSINAVGAGGSLTGKGANVLIIDDIYKNHEIALSAMQREKVWDWFNSVAYTRLEPQGAIIIIQTRWHKDDLVGRLLKEGKEDWYLVNFPAIAQEEDILGRRIGEALWPERYNEEDLAKIKEQIGVYFWNSLYQQNPISEENQLFRSEWIKYYDSSNSFEYIIQSWDTAFKDKSVNDYTVCTTWGVLNNNFYLISLFRQKLQFPELIKKAVELYELHKPGLVLVEDAASGQSLIQVLRRETNLPIKAIKLTGDKFTRASIISPLFEAGRVYFPKNAPFIKTIENELFDFPFGAHDDIVDSLTQALTYLKDKFVSNKIIMLPQLKSRAVYYEKF